MRLKAFFQRVLPPRHHIQGHRQLRFLGTILHDPNIFHLTRRSAAGGVATGLFVAFLPIPGQMIVSALAAILFRVNLPLAVVLVWLTNPVTMPPIFFLAYETGAKILNRTPHHVQFEPTLRWLETTFTQIWPSLLLGCFVLGTVSAVIGYVAIRVIWRAGVVKKWEERKLAQQTRNQSQDKPPG